MIRALVDFALNNKFVVLAIACLLLGWGALSFHNLPVEAYPDIADNYVTVITQWAGPFRRRSGTASYHPDRDSNGRYAAHDLSALRVDIRPVVCDHDLRRQLGERLESPKGAGKADTGQSAAGAESAAANRHGLEHDRADLLVHPAELESALRPDGVAVARRLGPAQAIQVRSQRGGCFRFRRHGARVPGACGSRTSWCRTD